MCVVSMVHDWGRTTIPLDEWDVKKWNKLKDLIKKAEEIDKATGQPDCVDPEKERWAREMEERMKRIEDKIDKVLK